MFSDFWLVDYLANQMSEKSTQWRFGYSIQTWFNCDVIVGYWEQ